MLTLAYDLYKMLTLFSRYSCSIISRILKIRKNIFNLHVAGNVNCSSVPLSASEDNDLADWLAPATSQVDLLVAYHLEQCTPITRLWFLEGVEEWINKQPKNPLYWLNGEAGIGKVLALQKLYSCSHVLIFQPPSL